MNAEPDQPGATKLGVLVAEESGEVLMRSDQRPKAVRREYLAADRKELKGAVIIIKAIIADQLRQMWKLKNFMTFNFERELFYFLISKSPVRKYWFYVYLTIYCVAELLFYLALFVDYIKIQAINVIYKWIKISLYLKVAHPIGFLAT